MRVFSPTWLQQSANLSIVYPRSCLRKCESDTRPPDEEHGKDDNEGGNALSPRMVHLKKP